MFEEASRETAISIIIDYDSGVPKSRIMKKTGLSMQDIDYCIDNRHKFGA
jgi:hypothetical protein